MPSFNGTLVRLTLTAIAALLLSACGNLPQPFQNQSALELPLPATPSTMGIGVIPVFGITNEEGVLLSGLIADVMQQRDLPAQAVDGIGRMRFSLETTIIGTRRMQGFIEVGYEWRVLGRTRDTVRYAGSDSLVIDEGEWRNRSDAGFNQIANALANRVADEIAPPLSSPETTRSPWQGLTVLIQPPEEAPGDGAVALSRTLAGRLSRLGFEPGGDKADFTVSGSVSLSQYDSVQDDIAILWQVRDTTGADLGEVRLDNRIPKGELDGSWGLVAEAIIDTALPGILEIMAANTTGSLSE